MADIIILLSHITVLNLTPIYITQEDSTMKKTIAAILAAALAVVPAASSLTANAATAYNTDRTYVMLSKLSSSQGHTAMPTLDIKQTRKYNPDSVKISAGSLNGRLYNNYSGANLVPYPAPNGQKPTFFSGAYFDLAENSRGIIMSFTCTNSSKYTPEQLGYTVSKSTVNASNAATAVTFDRTVRVGDVSAYFTTNTSPDYNGITTKDATYVYSLINYFGKGNFATLFYSYDKVIDLKGDIFQRYTADQLNSNSTVTINGTRVSMKMALNAVLASDINNDGLVTPTDASAIMRRIANPSKFPNFAVFNGLSDYAMYQKLNK